MEYYQQQVRPRTQDTNPREVLRTIVAECCQCSDEFYKNVALIADCDGHLTDEQVDLIIEYFKEAHARHVH